MENWLYISPYKLAVRLSKQKNPFVHHAQFYSKYCVYENPHFVDLLISYLVYNFKTTHLYFWTVNCANHLCTICTNILTLWTNKTFICWENLNTYITCCKNILNGYFGFFGSSESGKPHCLGLSPMWSSTKYFFNITFPYFRPLNF